jgi:hypothetical protein
MHYNVDTITDVPPSYTLREIDYIKVARIDQKGADNTLSLQELRQFIWTDSTAGKIDLTVLNITEYPTYYLYKVKSIVWRDLIYYADDNVLNYAFSASSAGSMTATANLFYLNNWNVINNATGQWGGVYYKFALTPNCNITYTASINVTNPNGSSVNFNFGFWSSNDFVSFTPIQTSSLQTLGAGASTTVTLKGISYNQFFGQTDYWLETKNNTLPLTITNASWVITQSQAPQLFTSSVVIEPYLLSTFTNSDCDVLMNNASQNDISQTRQRVLYENGGTIPSNLQQIIRGTAEYAEVNDYLYNANANILPRYEGVRVIQQQINKWTPGDISPSQTPSVTDLQTYFAYFDYIQDTTSEIIGKSAAHILYLIDKDGVIQTPTLTGSYYYNLIDNFETDKYANIIIEGENGDKQFIGNKKIIRPGVIPRAVLYTQTGSGYNVQNGLFFGSSGSVATDPINYVSRYTTAIPQQTLGYGSSNVLNLDYTTLASPYISLNPGNNWLEIISGSNNVQISFALYVTFFLSNPTYAAPYNQYQLELYLEKSTDGGSSWFTAAYTPFDTRPYNGTTNSTNNWTLQTRFIPVTGDLYRYRFVNSSGYYIVIIKPQTYILVSQVPPATAATASITIGNYWYTGSTTDGTPKNVINSSQLYPLYTPSNPIYQTYNPDDGYAPCLPFVIYPGDQIRFEGDELQTYVIGDVDTPNISTYQTSYSNFQNTAYWSFTGVNWSLNFPSPGTASCTGGAYNINNTLGFQPTLGTTFNDQQLYTFNIDVLTYTSGDIELSLDGGITSVPVGVTGIGAYSVDVQAGGSPFPPTPQLIIFSNNFIGSIANIAGGNKSLVLTLDRDIVDGTDLNSFLIRRFEPHPNFVVIDNQVLSGSGFLFPEFSTNELRQNFDNISVSLRERTLI